jgi:predicted dehydrogenase/sugar phosphate isomerase/epimerase
MELSLMTFPMAGDVMLGRMNIDKICKMADKANLHYIDIMEFEIKINGMKKTKQALKDNNIKVSCLMAELHFLTGKEDKIREKIKMSLEHARELGTDKLMIIPFSALEIKKLQKLTKQEKQDRLVKYFTMAVQMGKKENIKISVEDTPNFHVPLAKIEDCKYLLERVPGLGLAYDTANMLVEGEDPIAFYQELKQFIRHVHLKDIKYVKDRKMADRTRDGKRFICCPWGEGIIPISKIADMLRADGYTDTAGIEYSHADGKGTYEVNRKQLGKYTSYWRQRPVTPLGILQMRNGKVFGWAYIGAGKIAEQTANKIMKTGSHKIVSVYNRTFSKAESFALKYGAKACPTIEEAVRAEEVEGVYIATTTNNHFEVAKECLELGKAVLLEKTFAMTKAEAEELVRIAREKKVYLAEAMWTWFSPVARQVREWVQSDNVGKIKDVKITYTMPMMTKYSPRLTDPNLAGGALFDIGIYPITYCYNLFGQPEKVECVGNLIGGVDLEEDVTLTYSNGLKVTARISMVKSKGLENLVITGENGTVKCFFYHVSNRAILIRANAKKIIFKGNGGYDNQFTRVAEEILNGQMESNYVPLQSTLDNMETIDECRRQLGLIYPFESHYDSR